MEQLICFCRIRIVQYEALSALFTGLPGWRHGTIPANKMGMGNTNTSTVLHFV